LLLLLLAVKISIVDKVVVVVVMVSLVLNNHLRKFNFCLATYRLKKITKERD
jgi:hypothetical protein